ncbi:helix-turn-helix transcriptional regulator [Actinoplanes oblitus]|uniref:Helix-turn-helix transcriptional regulator n=1 Tax=Actinoplanes oblitus TaxID=3040509 RepID=A0ABY8W5J8_9ACTN|nr:helix-turn-helix transcriptional regulator [Actinoplanes oblitus]WIM93126.1 helix-turn-helix transcriptional regulator [Actinoplanes oblitus]
MIDVFQTADLDEARDMLDHAYSRVRLSAAGDEHRMRLARLAVGPIQLHHLGFRMRFTADFAAGGVIAIGRHIAGKLSRRVSTDLVDSGPGDLLLAAQPEHALRIQLEDYEGEHARFPPELFAQVAATAPSRTPQPVRFLGYRPLSARAATTWNKTFDYVLEAVVGLDHDAAPLLIGSAARMLAAVTLSTFPNTALQDPTVQDRHDAHPATLRRACDFIEANADRDIAPMDIAVAARVTLRSVQLAFRRYLNTTPTAYLRQVRLQRAHRELVDSDPGATTVSAVAMRWGFASHSTFAARYRSVYGVPPSRTLHWR